MPTKPPKPCSRSNSGCTELIYNGERFCPSCKKQASINYEMTRETATQRGYDTRWRKIRKRHLQEYPMCMCDENVNNCQGQYLIANMVHHKDGNSHNHAKENRLSMHKSCHDKYHMKKGDRW